MTVEERAEAIRFFETMLEMECNIIGAKFRYSKLALEALKQESCEDAISRQAVIDINEHHHGQMPNHVNHEIWKEIKALPSVTPQQKMGKWIEHFDESGKWYECDQCHTDWGGPVNYCPNCGSKM